LAEQNTSSKRYTSSNVYCGRLLDVFVYGSYCFMVFVEVLNVQIEKEIRDDASIPWAEEVEKVTVIEQ